MLTQQKALELSLSISNKKIDENEEYKKIIENLKYSIEINCEYGEFALIYNKSELYSKFKDVDLTLNKIIVYLKDLGYKVYKGKYSITIIWG